MKHQENAISSIEFFTFKSHRKKDIVLYFSVKLITTKYFHFNKHYYSSVDAKIHYIIHTINDKMLLLNDTPYQRIVNKHLEDSNMGIERYSDGWRFKSFVEIPLNFKSLGVGRAVLNLLLKKAKEIAPDASMMGQLQGGSAEQHAIRDSFYKNIGFIYEGNHFKIDRIDNLKTFETIKDIEEVDLHQEFLALHSINENLTIQLATAKEDVKKNETAYHNVRDKYNRCSGQRMWVILGISIFALLYIIFKII